MGQQVPVVVIRAAERCVLIDGYLRVDALHRLHRDTAMATKWPLSEVEALLHHRHLERAADDDPETPLSLEAEADSLDPPTA